MYHHMASLATVSYCIQCVQLDKIYVCTSPFLSEFKSKLLFPSKSNVSCSYKSKYNSIISNFFMNAQVINL